MQNMLPVTHGEELRKSFFAQILHNIQTLHSQQAKLEKSSYIPNHFFVMDYESHHCLQVYSLVCSTSFDFCINPSLAAIASSPCFLHGRKTHTCNINVI